MILPSPAALPIGLGCSRIGSVNGPSRADARQLLHRALDEGVRLFDTSNIYGQGDSERLLAGVIGQRDDCIICSKAGKYLDWKKRLLVPLKGALRGVVQRSGQARSTVAAARAGPMPTCWRPEFLQKSLEGSLRRLNRPQIDVKDKAAADKDNIHTA
jgi:aryl-alcohol dehydrogenase-like predicted oxidoreductase